jgi:hypothetical protein
MGKTRFYKYYFRDVETSHFNPAFNEIKPILIRIISDFEEKCKSFAAPIIKNYFEKTIALRVKEKFAAIKKDLTSYKNWDSNDFSE